MRSSITLLSKVVMSVVAFPPRDNQTPSKSQSGNHISLVRDKIQIEGPPQLAQSVSTQYITINGTKIAYRRFGKKNDYPLLYLTHLRGSMDTMDPLLLNTIAQNREIILIDNTGVGHSEGTIPNNVETMANTVNAFISAIKLSKVDLWGFSMGGMIAQSVAISNPSVVHKLILAGTQPGTGPGTQMPEAGALEAGSAQNPSPQTILDQFFYNSTSSRAIGLAVLPRLLQRNAPGEKTTSFVTGPGIQQQIAAIKKWTTGSTNFADLDKIKVPVLVTSGQKDVLCPAPNSFAMQQKLVDAELHVYPNSGHGHLYQEPVLYAKYLEIFLENRKGVIGGVAEMLGVEGALPS